MSGISYLRGCAQQGRHGGTRGAIDVADIPIRVEQVVDVEVAFRIVGGAELLRGYPPAPAGIVCGSPRVAPLEARNVWPLAAQVVVELKLFYPHAICMQLANVLSHDLCPALTAGAPSRHEPEQGRLAAQRCRARSLPVDRRERAGWGRRTDRQLGGLLALTQDEQGDHSHDDQRPADQPLIASERDAPSGSPAIVDLLRRLACLLPPRLPAALLCTIGRHLAALLMSQTRCRAHPAHTPDG